LRKFGERIDEAWQDFNLRDVPKPLAEAADERQIFMPYFLFQWPDARRTTARGQGGVVARWYMLEKSKQLTAMQRMFLEQATRQPLSFYEVVWNEPGERVRVRDVLIGGETEVVERSGSRHLRQGDLLFAQIWHQPELAVFGSMAPICIPPDKKIEVIELRKILKEENRQTESLSRAARPVAICRSDSRHLPGHSGPTIRSAGPVQHGRRPAAVSHADVSDPVDRSGVRRVGPARGGTFS
jgi:hypothetical protein